MRLERSDVEFAIWRKKVDKSLFEHNGTTIPDWACKMWRLDEAFGCVSSRKEARAHATVLFEKRRYEASVTTTAHAKRPASRLWFDPALSLELKHSFLMSYMRSLEGTLDSSSDVEAEIPFWEFLDIEFDRASRSFRFVAYYTVRPQFPSLFRRLIGSPSIKRIEDELAGKGQDRIHKQDWKPRAELEYELGAENVIYMLLDSRRKQFYVGEAADLVKRLLSPHPSIPDWDHFRYNTLPESLRPFRIALERMVIRDFASVLCNKNGIDCRTLDGCVLTNDRIDR